MGFFAEFVNTLVRGYQPPVRHPKPKLTGRRARNYPECRFCRSTQYTPRGNGEIVARFGWMYIRQPFTCSYCGVRYLLVRRIDSETWYTNMGAAVA